MRLRLRRRISFSLPLALRSLLRCAILFGATTDRATCTSLRSVSCYRRRTYLGTGQVRGAFVEILNEVRARFCFRLIGYVVMPEHVHLLISEPKTGDPSKVLQVLK
jgi:hypothetical protein